MWILETDGYMDVLLDFASLFCLCSGVLSFKHMTFQHYCLTFGDSEKYYFVSMDSFIFLFAL